MTELIEIEDERHLSREQAAAWLRSLADSLARHNEVEFIRNGIKFHVAVPDDVTMEVEIEVEADESKIEIEISW
jgi:amphi-Trp domain-containing protein